MSRLESIHPTDLELDILKVLWSESPLPVRDVRARLKCDAGRPLAHSSVITMLNIMHGKGYVSRKKEGKAFLFSPRVGKDRVTGNMTRDLMSPVFDGSAKALVLNLLDTAELDADELAEIRKLVTRKAKEHQP